MKYAKNRDQFLQPTLNTMLHIYIQCKTRADLFSVFTVGNGQLSFKSILITVAGGLGNYPELTIQTFLGAELNSINLRI